MSMSFEHTTLGQRVLFGTGQAAEHLAAELEQLGASRPMVIAGEFETELAKAATAKVTPAVWWDEVVMHVPVEVAERARAAAGEADADVLVSVGGGSTTGLAKAVALTTGIPVIAIPTTYAGSEATNVWGLTEDRTKTTGVDDKVLPVTVIYDAELSKTLPVEMSVASGLNGMAHCVDSLWAPRTDPINQALALEGARALALALRGIVADADDMDAREQALYGCYLAAVSFAGAGSGLHHKICHVLGGTFDLPHAQTHATVLPYVLELNAPAVPQLADRLAAALGGEVSGDPAAAAVNALRELYEAVDAPSCLADYGFTAEGIPEAVERVLKAAPASNPVAVTEQNMTELLTAALNGDRTQGEAAEQARREEELIGRVLESFEGTPDARLKELMQSLVKHLHAYIRDVRLTEVEWDRAIEFLTAVGHITDDRRQEFVLLSDVLGASMQTIAVSNPAEGDATEATVFGPFFVDDAPKIEHGEDIAGGASGQPSWVEGTVKNVAGEPIPGARIEVWEADDDGFYDVQYDDNRVAGRAYLISGENGEYSFWGLTPTPYPIPHDGPVGKMLAATNRSPVRAAHLHFMVTAPGYRTLVTHIFVEGDPQLEIGDSVFSVKDSLIKHFEEQPAGTPTPNGRDLGEQTWTKARFDIVLAESTEDAD